MFHKRLVRSGRIIYSFIDRYNAKSAFENILILNFIVLGFSTFSVLHNEDILLNSIGNYNDFKDIIDEIGNVSW